MLELGRNLFSLVRRAEIKYASGHAVLPELCQLAKLRPCAAQSPVQLASDEPIGRQRGAKICYHIARLDALPVRSGQLQVRVCLEKLKLPQ